MSSSKTIRIYVDTNVLINYRTEQTADVSALKYVFSKRRKEVLFTSSLAVVQTITQLQSDSKMYKRKAYSRETTIEKLNEILSKFTVLDLSYFEVKEGFNLMNNERTLCFKSKSKMRCNSYQ